MTIDLKVGSTYRAKRPARYYGGDYNDRTIVWISDDGNLIQYDGTAVRHGARLPVVSRDAFLKWAKERLPCVECDDTGMADSGGTHPWGECISIPCQCGDKGEARC